MSGDLDIRGQHIVLSDADESDVDSPPPGEAPEAKSQARISDYYQPEATTGDEGDAAEEASSSLKLETVSPSKIQESTESDDEFSALVDMVTNRPSKEYHLLKNAGTYSQSTPSTKNEASVSNTNRWNYLQESLNESTTSENVSLIVNTSQVESNSSFNITDSTETLPEANELSQLHCISVDVISEDADNVEEGEEEEEEEEEVVNSSQISLTEELSDSEKKSGAKKHYQVSHRMGDLKFTKARRITAKLKKQWTSDLQDSGMLVCPMPGCHQTYKTVTNFQTHYKWCSGKKDLQHCPYCDSLIIAGREAVLHHMQVEHPDKMEEFKEKLKEYVTESRSPATNILGRKVPRKYKLKSRGLSSKENFISREKTSLKSGIKTVDKTAQNFKKCVRFNDIVQKINSVNEEPYPKANLVVKKKLPRQTHQEIFQLNAQTETQYFSDESDTVDDPESEKDSPIPSKRITTKSRIVLNTQGYERFNQYLKLTRDWASERKTYSRSRSEEDNSLNESYETNEESSSTMELTDSYQLNESITSISLAVSKSELDEEEMNPNHLGKLSMKNEKVTRSSHPQRGKKTFREIPMSSDLISTTEETASSSTEGENQKSTKFSQAQSTATTDPREMNYGHVVFSKPNKVANRERVTCYDNAGNVSIKLSHSSKSDTYRKYQRNESPATELITFDSLLASMNTTKDAAASKTSGESETKQQEIATPSNEGKSYLKKYGRETKYQKQIDGIKLPKSGRGKKNNVDSPSKYNEALKESYIPNKRDISTTEGVQSSHDSNVKLKTLKDLSLSAVISILEKCDFVSNWDKCKNINFDNSYHLIGTLINHMNNFSGDKIYGDEENSSNSKKRENSPLIKLETIQHILTTCILPSIRCYSISPVPSTNNMNVKKRGRRPKIVEQLKQLFLNEKLDNDDELDRSITITRKKNKDLTFSPPENLSVPSNSVDDKKERRYHTRERKRRSTKYGPEFDLDDNSHDNTSGPIVTAETKDMEIAQEIQQIIDDSSLKQIHELVSKEIAFPPGLHPSPVEKRGRGRPPKLKRASVVPNLGIEVPKSKDVSSDTVKTTEKQPHLEFSIKDLEDGLAKDITVKDRVVTEEDNAEGANSKDLSMEKSIGVPPCVLLAVKSSPETKTSVPQGLPIIHKLGRKRKLQPEPDPVPLKQQKLDPSVETCTIPKKRGRPRTSTSSPLVPAKIAKMDNDSVGNDLPTTNAESPRKCARKGRPMKCVRYKALNSGIDSPERIEDTTPATTIPQKEVVSEESLPKVAPDNQISNDSAVNNKQANAKQLAISRTRRLILNRKRHHMKLLKMSQRRRSDEVAKVQEKEAEVPQTSDEKKEDKLITPKENKAEPLGMPECEKSVVMQQRVTSTTLPMRSKRAAAIK